MCEYLDGVYVEVGAGVVVHDGHVVVADVLALLVARRVLRRGRHRRGHVEQHLHKQSDTTDSLEKQYMLLVLHLHRMRIVFSFIMCLMVVDWRKQRIILKSH